MDPFRHSRSLCVHMVHERRMVSVSTSGQSILYEKEFVFLFRPNKEKVKNKDD